MNNIKLMFADKIKIFSRTLFYIFVFLLPWQTRLILTPEKPELLSFSIYLSEIVLWLTILFWLGSGGLKKIKAYFVFVLFCFFALLSLFWAPDKMAAFRVWLYVLEGGLVYFYLKNENTARLGTAYVFLSSLFLVSIFGIWQFFNLGSPAWKWLGLAERGAWNLGDIIIETAGGRWLRAYGSFPHPNIFGGYLATGILLVAIILSDLPTGGEPNNSQKRKMALYFTGAIFVFSLFLTFSRSAWLALFIALIYFVIKNIKSREFRKFFVFLLVLAIALSIIFWPFLKTRATSSGRLEQKSNTERVASWRDGLLAWRANPFFGTGAGNYTVGRSATYGEPPHNVFILSLAELGIFGFVAYLFLWRRLWKNKAARALILLFFIIGIFDHYLWSLYSGQILLWLGLSLTRD